MLKLSLIVAAFALAAVDRTIAAPAASSSSSSAASAPTFVFPSPASQDPNDSLLDEFATGQPEPIRGNLGAPIRMCLLLLSRA